MANLIEKHRIMLESKRYGSLNESQIGPMAQLLENQDKELKSLKESGTVTADVAQYLPILVPLIRRTYPNLIANTIAGVQALQAPTGAIFALTGRLLGKDKSADSHISGNKGQILVMADASGIDVNTDITGETNTASKGKVVYKEGNKVLVSLTGDAFVTNETIGGKKVEAVYSNEAAFQTILTGYTGPVDTATGETEGVDMKEVGLVVEKVEAKVQTRNLKGRYTLETLQDLKSLYGADAEKEVMTILSNEVQREIDNEVRDYVNKAAYQLPDFDFADGGRWDIEKIRTLTLKIANEAREISRTSRRGPGNVLLVSPKIATALEAVGNFVLSPASGSINVQETGINPVIGKFDNKYTVAVDNFADNDYFTILYKGSDKDAGVFFAPYVGLTFVKVVDPESGNPAIILKTRYDILDNPLGASNFMRTAVVNLGNIIK